MFCVRIESENDGQTILILEGFIAMIWAAAVMGLKLGLIDAGTEAAGVLTAMGFCLSQGVIYRKINNTGLPS